MNFIKYLENDIALVQDAMDAHIKVGDSLTADKVYQIVKDNLTSASINDAIFRSALSENIKEGNITGFKGKRGKGYVRTAAAEENTEVEADEVESESEVSKFKLMITHNSRITLLDRHNFGYQVRNGSAWVTKTYYPTLQSAIKSAAKEMIKKEIGTDTVELKALGELIANVESSLIKMIIETSGQTDINSKASDFKPEKK